MFIHSWPVLSFHLFFCSRVCLTTSYSSEVWDCARLFCLREPCNELFGYRQRKSQKFQASLALCYRRCVNGEVFFRVWCQECKPSCPWGSGRWGDGLGWPAGACIHCLVQWGQILLFSTHESGPELPVLPIFQPSLEIWPLTWNVGNKSKLKNTMQAWKTTLAGHI